MRRDVRDENGAIHPSPQGRGADGGWGLRVAGVFLRDAWSGRIVEGVYVAVVRRQGVGPGHPDKVMADETHYER
jgi:hypothetical protein